MRSVILLFCLIPVLIQAQVNPNLSYDLVRSINQAERVNRSNDHDIHLILKGDVKKLSTFIKNHKGSEKYSISNLIAATLPVSALSELSHLEYLKKAEAYSGALHFNDVVAIAQTRVDTVYSASGLLQQSYTGKDVIFGMIDSGIDPTHPDFQNDDGTTRIIAFWDQNDKLSNLPPYGYGKEYTQTDIDNGAMTSYLDTTYGGHGSAVAGVAAGGGMAHPDIRGMAPEADIIVVGIDPSVLDYLDRTPSMLNIVDAIDYIFSYADALDKPAVINISLGGIEGSHDGQDLPTQMIDALIEEKAGRAVVTSAGNAANTQHHIQFNVDNDTLFTWFKSMYSNSALCKRDSGAYMSFYGDSADVVNLQFSISAEERFPCCDILDETGFKPFLSSLGQIGVDTLWDSVNIVGIVSTYVEKMEGTYAYFMEIETDHMDLLWRYSITGNGRIDGWAGPLSARSCNSTYILNPAFVGTPSQIENYNNFILPDNDQTIGTAYACSKNVITVGAYDVRTSMTDVDSFNRSYFTNPLYRASFSSLGPTRDGRIKPEIMATGSRIVTTQASHVLAQKATSERYTLYLGGQHSITDGTSFAAPAVAGIVALYFEKHPYADINDVRHAMITTALEDPFMGPMPNNSYGYGRINAYKMLLDVPAGIPEELQTLDALIYPNPARGQIIVQLPYSEHSEKYQISVYNLLGVAVYREVVQSQTHFISLEQKGSFVVFIRNEKGEMYSKMVIVK
ncbi:MAG: S8 family serine peptidase [Chitinophagales bacterium]|nr:S8 family serine peptidase [Chitinophagales bacterium]